MFRSKKYQPRKKGHVSKRGGIRRVKTMRKIKKRRLTKKKMKGGKKENLKILILPIYEYVLSFSNTENKIKMWDKDGGKDQWIVTLTQDNPVLFVACFPDGETIMSVCKKYIYLWKSVDNQWRKPIKKEINKDEKITCVAVCQKEEFIAFVTYYSNFSSSISKIDKDGNLTKFTIKDKENKENKEIIITQIAFSDEHCFFTYKYRGESNVYIRKAKNENKELKYIDDFHINNANDKLNLMVLPDGTCFYQSDNLSTFWFIDATFKNPNQIRFEHRIPSEMQGRLMTVYNKDGKNYFVFYCNNTICVAEQPHHSFNIYDNSNKIIESKSITEEQKQNIENEKTEYYTDNSKNPCYIFQRDFCKFEYCKTSNVTSLDILPSSKKFICGYSDSFIRFFNLLEFKSDDIYVIFFNNNNKKINTSNALSVFTAEYKITFCYNSKTMPYDNTSTEENTDFEVQINSKIDLARLKDRMIKRVCKFGSQNCVEPENNKIDKRRDAYNNAKKDAADKNVAVDNNDNDSELESVKSLDSGSESDNQSVESESESESDNQSVDSNDEKIPFHPNN
jgi:hypothetical protein